MPGHDRDQIDESPTPLPAQTAEPQSGRDTRETAGPANLGIESWTAASPRMGAQPGAHASRKWLR
jgi:hypothetical protein